eukprot:bmy_02882T0
MFTCWKCASESTSYVFRQDRAISIIIRLIKIILLPLLRTGDLCLEVSKSRDLDTNNQDLDKAKDKHSQVPCIETSVVAVPSSDDFITLPEIC